MLIHEHALVKVREDMPMDRAALIGCSTTTGVGAVFHTAGVEPGSTVVVIGCGGVGLAAINGAAIAGAGQIIAVDRVDSKLNWPKVLVQRMWLMQRERRRRRGQGNDSRRL